MRIFIAGATGAIGTALVPRLVRRGHEVVGMTRRPEKAEDLRRAGAEAVVADALDRAAVVDAMRRAEPEVVVHQLTALAGASDLRRFERAFAATNRLRTEGTDILIAAAREAGARRFVAQSFAGWPFERKGGLVKSEDDPLDPNPPRAFATTLDAIRHLERAVTSLHDIDGVVLRYGILYGPGTALTEGGEQIAAVRRGRLPVVGSGAGVWSFVHVEDAADATTLAIEGSVRGIYHVVDDEPAPVVEWLPVLASAAGGPAPRRVPTWIARALIGTHGVVMMTQSRGASNAKVKRELGWRPQYPSWRAGFEAALRPRAEAA